MTAQVTAEVAQFPNRCTDCLCDLPHGNRCEACEKDHRCFTSERGRELPHVGNHHPSTPRSERQFHGDGYQP